MADITDATAIAYSNNSLRVGADLLAQSYNLCDATKAQWDGLGGGQSALDVASMQTSIRTSSARLMKTLNLAFERYRLWFAAGVNSLITNSADDAIVDGSPSDGRPAINGDDGHNIATQLRVLQGWLFNGTFSFSLVCVWAEYDTVLQMNKPTLVLADVQNYITRCGELKTQMEANTNAKLNQVLAVAVNPGS